MKMKEPVLVVDADQRVHRGTINMAPTGPQKRVGVLLENGRMVVVGQQRVRKEETS